MVCPAQRKTIPLSLGSGRRVTALAEGVGRLDREGTGSDGIVGDSAAGEVTCGPQPTSSVAKASGTANRRARNPIIRPSCRGLASELG